MFRPSTPEDITDFEFKAYVEPHFNLVESYLKKFLIPDYWIYVKFLDTFFRHLLHFHFSTIIQPYLNLFQFLSW